MRNGVLGGRRNIIAKICDNGNLLVKFIDLITWNSRNVSSIWSSTSCDL